jgi:hypothetical protein
MRETIRRLVFPNSFAFLAAAAGSLAAQQVTLNPDLDNTIYEDPTGNLSNGQGEFLFAGRSPQLLGIQRGLLRFDVAGSIPKHATITSVSLTLDMDRTANLNPFPVSLHRVAQSWGEGASKATMGEGGGAPAQQGDATWLHRFFATSSWTNKGGDFAATASASQLVGPIGVYTWNSTAALVADVQLWLDQPGQNFGWMLLGDENVGTNSKRFGSRDNLIPTVRPMLTIGYGDPKAAVISTGQGCKQSAPNPLQSAGSGVPALGNQNFAVDVSNGPGNTSALLFTSFGLSPGPIPFPPSCNFYLDATRVLQVLSVTGVDGAGSGRFALPIPNDAPLVGAELDTQTLVVDLAAPFLLVASNALTLRLGR